MCELQLRMQCEAGYFHARKDSLGSMPGLNYRASSYVSETRSAHELPRDASTSYSKLSLNSTYSSKAPALEPSSHPNLYPYSSPFDQPRRLVRSSDSYPVLSTHLEDRLLQLADRSRRLGVHRFSRSRQSLVLNTPPVVIAMADQYFVDPRKQHSGLHLPLPTRATYRE